jgi:hypothetical protein
LDGAFQTSDTDKPEDEGGYGHEEPYPLPLYPSNLPYAIETIDLFDLKTSDFGIPKICRLCDLENDINYAECCIFITLTLL